jgi:hypothetical protein
VERLASRHGFSVVNLGVPSTGSISHERILEDFGLAYQPRLVIWQWYGNDFNEDYGLTHSGDSGVTAPVFPDDKVLSPLDRWLLRNSAVFSIAHDIAASREFAQANPVWVDPDEIADGNLHLFYGRPYTLQAHTMNSPRNQAGFDLTRRAIVTARDLLTQQGIPLVILLIPTKEEVYRAWTEPVLGSSWLEAVSAGRQTMLELCKEQNLSCIDAFNALSQVAANKELLYWSLDSHLNPAGNQVVAEAVWKYLGEHGLARMP